VILLSGPYSIIKRLKNYIRLEAKAQYDAIHSQWSQPLKVRVAKGWAIEGVSVVKFDGDNLRLRCEKNDSRFREGDLILLHRGNPAAEDALHLDLEFDGDLDLEARLVEGNPHLLFAYPHGWLIDQDYLDLSLFYLGAMNVVADSKRGREIILPMLQGTREANIDFERYERVYDEFSDLQLNAGQIDAIAQAYGTDLFHLIQGPPGTGKTLTLAHLAKLLADDGQRVLVTGLTHRSINNALNKIALLDKLLPICKIGQRRQMEGLIVENYDVFMGSPFGELSGGYIIGATPFALQTCRLANVEFDVILFDEASQVTLPLAIMGMLAGNKFIFFGDENQLPPVSVYSAKQAFEYSVFNFLAGRGNESMLEVTYRLNDALAHWPSKTFYQERLRPSNGVSSKRLLLSGESSRWDFVLDPEKPAVFLDLGHSNTTIRSQFEAEIVVELILSLLGHGISPDEIGVIAPYRAQSRLIRSLLRHAIEDKKILSNLIVDTVERMQGQEREVVLVSFATSNLAFANQVAEFLFQPQRLNVAVTRSRTKLILVGSHHMFEQNGTNDSKKDAIFSLLRSLIEHCVTLSLTKERLV
jgi:DNA replication ATP-dependent helicase Dna2